MGASALLSILGFMEEIRGYSVREGRACAPLAGGTGLEG